MGERRHFAALSSASQARGLQGKSIDGKDKAYDDLAQQLKDTAPHEELNKTKLLQATCTIDVLYIVACLGYAIDSLYYASASANSRCPDSSAQGCAVEVT